MQRKSLAETYDSFIEFVRKDAQLERRRTNRRMFHVLLWCFVAPIGISVLTLILIRLGILNRSFRTYVDWSILIFPIFYSTYVFSSEVLVEIPGAFRQGTLATALSFAQKESQWRQRVSESLRGNLDFTSAEWDWVICNFDMDLRSLRYRTQFLTALAGVAFFLLTQGLDFLGEPETNPLPEHGVMWKQLPWPYFWSLINPGQSPDLSQILALLFFLVMFYLSGIQTYTSLKRYLQCAKLRRLESASAASRP